MKEMGMEKVIFGKDNCLALEKAVHFIDEETRRCFIDVIELFGQKNVMIMTSLTD